MDDLKENVIEAIKQADKEDSQRAERMMQELKEQIF
jgi:cellobiose-specific phosphotransferase system component IIA